MLSYGTSGFDVDFTDQAAESGAENDRDLGPERTPPADGLRGRLHLVEQRGADRHAAARSPNNTVPSLIIVAPSSTATA